jgi:hypothetical protein
MLQEEFRKSRLANNSRASLPFWKHRLDCAARVHSPGIKTQNHPRHFNQTMGTIILNKINPSPNW